MTKEEYIKENPNQFKDELDKWLFKEFDILGGACSSIESLKYSVAREVAEKAIEYVKQQMMKDAIDGHICIPKGNVGDIYFQSEWVLSAKYPHSKYDKVKLIIIKEESV